MKIEPIKSLITTVQKKAQSAVPKKLPQAKVTANLSGLDSLASQNKVLINQTQNKNNVVMKMIRDLGDGHKDFTFFDGDKAIGQARLAIIQEGSEGLFPSSWYLKENSIETKPICKVVTFLMNDKEGMTEYSKRADGKKYGTMCMQKILDFANSQKCEDRITLLPARLNSDVSPAPFYAKIGFDISPSKKEILKDFIHPDEIVDGRFIARPGTNVNLTNPEVLKNYLK